MTAIFFATKSEKQRKYVYRRTRRPSISYLQEHGLDLSISCQIKASSEWKLDLMAAKVFEHLTFDKGKTVKEVYKILSRCMAEEKTVRISRKAMLEKSIAKQRERLDKYIDLCADGIITKQELMERRKGLDNQIAELQSQYESVEQEDERSGALDMNLISQKLDTENVLLRVQDARETLQLANGYMAELGKGIHELTTIKLSDRKVQEFINEFFPITEDLTDGQRKNNLRLQEDLKARYYNAPDLAWVGKNGWRFVNAVSDFATHADPIRKTRNYNENLFLRTAEGNPMIDKAYKMVLAAA